MFDRIEFAGLKKSENFGYAAELPFFKKRKQLEFKPGLNILFGPNGCGKSTILNILGQTMMAVQGGQSVVTLSAIDDVLGYFGDKGDKLGLKVFHDGKPVVYCDPRDSIGLRTGGFDDDFFGQGMNEIMNRKSLSHGQLSYTRIERVLHIFAGKKAFPAEIVFKEKKANVNDVWKRRIEKVEAMLAANIEPGQPTILLDEPEANYSLDWQSGFWHMIEKTKAAERFQIIMATHSPFALGIKGANYIDFEPGYRERIEQFLYGRFGAGAPAQEEAPKAQPKRRTTKKAS